MMPWYYAGPEAKPVGPVTLEELQALRVKGVVAPETYVIEETGQGAAGLAWKRYRDVFPAVPTLPPLPPIPPASYAMPPPPPVALALPLPVHPLFPSAAPSPGSAHPPVFTPGARPDPYYQARSTNSWCAWGFGLSLAGIFFSLACGVGVLPALISLPLCIIGIAQVQHRRDQSGQGLAITGLVLSTVALILSLAIIILADIPMLKAHGLTVTEETNNDSE
jgi:hypothetical protein